MNKAWSWWIRKVHPETSRIIQSTAKNWYRGHKLIKHFVDLNSELLLHLSLGVWRNKKKNRETLWWHQETPTKRKRREHFPRPKWSQRTLVGSQRLRISVLVGRPLQKYTNFTQTNPSKQTLSNNSPSFHVSFQKLSPRHRFDEQKPTARYHAIFNKKHPPACNTPFCSTNWNHVMTIKMRNTEIQWIAGAIRCSPVDAWKFPVICWKLEL